MSRFARLQTGPVRTWAPPESPFRIEYASALLREVRLAGALIDSFGVLYGARHGATIRLVSTRGRAGLDPVGIFASRVRGHVFLTEEDLERFEKAEASVAMVISGETGGFFVRDAAGSMETVRSYQEFSLTAPAPSVAIAKPLVKKRRWHWAASLVLLPLLYFIPHKPPAALALKLDEDAGQLRITWNVPTEARLTIIDGAHRASINITRQHSSVTYARRTGDVTVGIGSLQTRFVGRALPPIEIEKERQSIESLKSQIVSLRAARVAGETKLATLQRRLQ
ncbi:MAG TPA: hypothetical protein VNU44_13425 [Bryobacteraceae bacterium]|nr:hypothetical protein [Bryobacteraceae bacterium]